MRLVNWRTLAASAASIALVACGDDVTVVQPPLNVTANPTSVACQVGQQTAVGVSASGGSGAPSITFASSNNNVTVAGSGAGATVTCNTVGSSVITVTVTPQGGGTPVTVAIPVTVTAAPSPISAILLTPQNPTIAVGGTQQFTATVLASGTGANTAVTYSSSNAAVATVDANTGLARGLTAGQTTIIARSVGNSAVVAATTLTVAPANAFVQGLSVSPATVTLQTGATQILTPNVTLAPGAPANTSRNVTCTSSDANVATVTGSTAAANCTITARGNGTATITIASEAAPSVAQTVTVTVRDPAPVRLTIQGVRVIGPAGTLVPADLNNVAGNLFVTLNLDPGDFRPDSVRLRLGNSVVNCQRFTADLAEAYRLALTTGAADVQPIECQINTSQFNPTTGAVLVPNGAQNLTAEVFYRPQGAAAGSQLQQAAIQQQLTVTNASGFFVQVTNTPTAAQAAVDADGQATGPQGVLWRAGAINVTVLPVNFTPIQSPGTQSFTITLQDAANGIVAQRTASADANASTFTATFPGATADVFDAAPAATDRVLNGYTSPNAGIAPAFNPAGAYVGGGTLVVVGTQAGTSNTIILNAAGQPAGLPAPAGGFTNAVAQPIFIDNQRPQPALSFGVAGPPAANFANTGAAFVGFVNSGFTFNNALTPQFLVTANNPASGFTTNNPDFGGVDRVTVAFFSSTTSNTPTTITSSGTRITTGADLPPSTTNTANNPAVLLTDALGNARSQRVQGGPIALAATPAGAQGTAVAGGLNLTFGVDISAPTVQQTAGFTSNRVVAVVAQQTYQFAGSDDIGFGVNPLLVTASRTARVTNGQTATGSSANPAATFCATGVDANNVLVFSATSGGTCQPIAVANSVTVPAFDGEFTISAMVRDQAGNTSAAITRQLHADATAPVVGGISLPQTLTGNAAVTFTTSATDNLELGSVRGEIDYGALLGLQYPSQSIGSAFDGVFTASNSSLSITIPSFIRSVTPTPGAVPSANRTLASTLRAVVADVAGNSASSAIGIPNGNLGNLSATSPFATANPVTNVSGFATVATENRAGGVQNGPTVTITGGATANTAASATVTVIQTGAVNTFISPFQRLELYVQVGTIGGIPQYAFIGTVPAGLVQDNPAAAPGQREIRSSFTLTSTTSPLLTAPAAGTNTYQVIAVGVNSAGDALVSQPITVNIVP